MKLNPNCIRAILLTVEEKCSFDYPWEYVKDEFDSKYLAGFSHDEIIYHIRQCSLSSLISGVHYYDSGDSILISDLTPSGHEFLANTRNETIWKKVISKASTASLPILLEIAKDAAKKYFLG